MFFRFWDSKKETELTPLKRVQQFSNAFAKVPMPLNPHHYDTKLVLELLFDQQVFGNLCDLLFGSVWAQQQGTKPVEVKTWMELAEDPKKAEFAEALFALLAPNGGLCKILQQLSAPSSDFLPNVCQGHWMEGKGREDPPLPDHDFIRPHYIPVTLFTAATAKLVITDNPEQDLTALPPKTIPSSLLVPFWKPPFVTKKVGEGSAGQRVTCMPGTAFAYFFVRMLVHLVHRSSREGYSLMAMDSSGSSSSPSRQRKTAKSGVWGTVVEKWHVLEKTILKTMNPSLCMELTEDFPFFNRLFKAYCQQYLTPNALSPLMLGFGYHDIQWGLNEATAGLMIHSPLQVWLHRVLSTSESEHKRAPTQRPGELTTLLFCFPLLRELWIPVATATQGRRGLYHQPPVSSEARQRLHECASACVVSSKDLLYHDILSALRQAFISIPVFPSCPASHLTSIFETWHSLISLEMETDPDQAMDILSKRYEAFSVLLGDFFLFSKATDFVSKTELPTLRALVKVLSFMRSHTCLGFLEQISALIERDPGARELEALRKQQCLIWEDADEGGRQGSLGYLLPVFSKEMVHQAIPTYNAARMRLETSSQQGLVDEQAHATGDIVQHLEKLFPEISKATERYHRASTRLSQQSTDSESARPSEGRRSSGRIQTTRDSQLLSDEARNDYLVGRTATKQNQIPDVRFDFFNARNSKALFVSSRRDPSTIASDEIPMLVTLSVFCDKLIEWVLERWPHKYPFQPTCEADHPLYITPQSYLDEHCTQHPEQPSVWWCPRCKRHYGAECKGPLCDLLTGKAVARRNPVTDAVCQKCHILIPNDETQVETGLGVVCERCFSLTPNVSVRRIASHSFLLLFSLFLFVVFIFLKIVF